MVKARKKDENILYEMYLKHKEHKETYRKPHFLKLLSEGMTVMGICERKYGQTGIETPITKEEYNKIEILYDQGISVLDISRKIGINKYRIEKYFVPKKELENLF